MKIHIHTIIGLVGAGFLIAGCGSPATETTPVVATPAPGANAALAADGSSTGSNSGPTTVPAVGDNFKLKDLTVGSTGLKSLFTVKILPASGDDGSSGPADGLGVHVATDSDANVTGKAPGGSASYVSATINLNGVPYTVTKGTMFPKDTQQFTVSSITKTTVVVHLTAGEFSDGSDGITLTKGKTTELENQSAGIDYRLLLVSTSTKDLVTAVTPTSASDPNNTITADPSDTSGDTSGDGTADTGSSTTSDGSSTTAASGTGFGTDTTSNN